MLQDGRRVVGKNLEIRVLPTTNQDPRFAIIVSTRVDRRATARNRIRRLVSEAVRLTLSRIRQDVDVVITVRRIFVTTQQGINTDVSQIFTQAHILL